MIKDEELKNLVKTFLKDMSRKYPEMRDTNKKVADHLEKKDDIDLYILHIADTFFTALKGYDKLFLSVMAAGIKEDMSMRDWVVYFYYVMHKNLIDKED